MHIHTYTVCIYIIHMHIVSQRPQNDAMSLPPLNRRFHPSKAGAASHAETHLWPRPWMWMRGTHDSPGVSQWDKTMYLYQMIYIYIHNNVVLRQSNKIFYRFQNSQWDFQGRFFFSLAPSVLGSTSTWKLCSTSDFRKIPGEVWSMSPFYNYRIYIYISSYIIMFPIVLSILGWLYVYIYIYLITFL